MTNRVYLRALEIEDHEKTVIWRNDDEVMNLLSTPKLFISPEEEKIWIEEAIMSTNEIHLGICLTENDEIIGLTSIFKMDYINRSCQSSFFIGNKEYWNLGYEAESQKILLDFCFNERNMERVWCLILENNIAYQEILTECGYVKECTLRNSIYKIGVYQNQVLMSVLRREFDELQNLRKE